MEFVKHITQAGGKVYSVGGAVRDSLLGVPSKDLDIIVTGIQEVALLDLLRAIGRVEAVGVSFGVFKFVPEGHTGEAIDIALPRVERSTGTGHKDFEVEARHDIPLEKDLGRRDFTINSMARDLETGMLIDPFHGQDDLKFRVLRMVFPEAFKEDPLRILRAIQFSARFGFVIERQTFQKMKEAISLVSSLSSERISIELRKLLSAARPSVGFRIMQNLGLLDKILPELNALVGIEQPFKYHHQDAFNHTLLVLDASANMDMDLDMRMAALVHDLGKAKTQKKEADGNIHFYGHQIVSKHQFLDISERLKLSSAGFDIERIALVVEHHMEPLTDYVSDKSVRKFIRKVGVDRAFDIVEFRVADKRGGVNADNIEWVFQFRKRMQDILTRKEPLSIRDLAINGNDLIRIGFLPSRKIGDTLNLLLEKVMEDPSFNTRETLEALALKELSS